MAADETEKANGGTGLTSVIANAGVAGGAVSQKGMASSAPIAATNFMGTVHTLSPIIPFFVERNYGQVVIMSSLSAFFPGIPFFTAYGASKAAQRSYGESLRGSFLSFSHFVLTSYCHGCNVTSTLPLVSLRIC